MLLTVRYFKKIDVSEIITIEVNASDSIEILSFGLREKLSTEIILIPAIVAPTDSQTIGMYLSHAAEEPVHFHAFNMSVLSLHEQSFLKYIAQGGTSDFAESTITLLSEALPKNIRDSLVVRFSDDVNMFGKTFTDTLTSKSNEGLARRSMQAHPYPWIGAGASNVIICSDMGKLYVALVYNKRRDKRPLSDKLRVLNVPDAWKIPEGYMHPRECKGGKGAISLVPSDVMDEAEELIYKEVPMNIAYASMREKFKHLPQHVHAGYDASTVACAMRESREEVGLNISPEKVQWVAQREENGLIQTIVNVYLLRADGSNGAPPPLQVDGIEIGEATWGKLQAFKFTRGNAGVQVFLDYFDVDGETHPVEVPIKYAIMIGQAIKKFREDEIESASKIEGCPLFTSRENIIAHVQRTLRTPALNPSTVSLVDIFGENPENILTTMCHGAPSRMVDIRYLSELGRQAEAHHKRCLAIAGAFRDAASLTAAQLVDIAREVPAMVTGLFYSRARWAPMERELEEVYKAISKIRHS